MRPLTRTGIKVEKMVQLNQMAMKMYLRGVEQLTSRLQRLDTEENGVTATEYVVLLVLVACFIIAVVSSFGEQIRRLYQEALDAVYFIG